MIKIIFSVLLLSSPCITFGQVVGAPYIFANNKIEFKIQAVTTLTGRIWLDRNLGADQVAPRYSLAPGDIYSTYFGDLYQWGRGSDGHEQYNSSTYTSQATSSSISSSDLWYGKFIAKTSPPDDYNWLNAQNDNLWQGLAGANNPCPTGYRIPTETEWFEEAKKWTSQAWTASRITEVPHAYASVLKIPAAGQRQISGALSQTGADVLYWTSTISGNRAKIIRVVYGGPFNFEDKGRANGYPVRCIKN